MRIVTAEENQTKSNKRQKINDGNHYSVEHEGRK